MKIMFICHGNICRSPMGEFILKDMLRKEHLTGHTVASSAVSREEIANPVYPPARRELAKHGISCDDITPDRSPVQSMTSTICSWSWTARICTG